MYQNLKIQYPLTQQFPTPGNLFCQHTLGVVKMFMHKILTAAVCKNKTLRSIKKGVIRDYGTKHYIVIFTRSRSVIPDLEYSQRDKKQKP